MRTSTNPTKLLAILLLVGAAGLALASQGGVTWGTNTIYLSDGAVCEQMVADGGFAAGADGGVCADGGSLCNSCSGTCALDGGWLPGAAIAAGINSDPIPAESALKVTCQCIGAPNNNASITAQIQGSTDVANPAVWLALPNSSFTCTLPDGGAGTPCGDMQTQGAVGRWNRLNQTAANGDGGLCCCTYEAQ